MSGLPTTERGRKPKWHYRAERTEDWGMGINGGLIAGLTLNPLPEDDPEGLDPKYPLDPLSDEIGEAHTEAPIHLPEGGLVEGRVYTLVYEAYTDWETGIVDDYDVYLVPVEAEE